MQKDYEQSIVFGIFSEQGAFIQMVRSYSEKTIKILFALSGNRCAFPGCPFPLIEIDEDDPDPVVLGEMCHVIASSPDGPRGSGSPKGGARDGHRNLILLCPTHHELIDKRPGKYSAEMLLAWKAQVEGRSKGVISPLAGASEADEERRSAALALRNQLDGLTKRSLIRSERIDDAPGSQHDSSLRLSDALYVERDIQSDLATRLAEVDEQRRSILVIGEPGVGKTSLLWSVVSDAIAAGQTAWLVDAPSLLRLFDDTISPGFAIQLLDTLCRWSEFRAAAPLLAIDTADLCLATGAASERFTELLSYLQHVNVRLLIASRPQESEELRFLNPHQQVLGDYSEGEFFKAVSRYARAYLGGSAPERCAQIAQELHASAAQGFPIREVALKPLTLRMLFSIYAPEDINHAEINIVELYDEFWRRRVYSDIRAGGRGGEAEAADLSAAARLLGIVMLGAGTPDVTYDMARTAFRRAAIDLGQLDQLASRGVVQYSGTGRNRTVTFFHQTFFEHAAAEAIASAPGAMFLEELQTQFLASGGNQFLGCVLERALVLAETRTAELGQASEKITRALLEGDEPFLSAGIYAFAHRSDSLPGTEAAVRRKIDAGHGPTIERLIAVAPNMGHKRRRAAVSMLGAAIAKGQYRRNEKIFQFLALTADQFPREVIAAIQDSGIVEEFTSDVLKTGQARMIFYLFAPKLVPADPEWVFDRLTKLAISSLSRLAGERDFDRACGAVAKCIGAYPSCVAAFVVAIEQAAVRIPSLSAGYHETRAYAGLLALAAPLTSLEFLARARAALADLPTQFIGRATLAAIALTVPLGDRDQIGALIRDCALSGDKMLLHAFGATTLTMLVERNQSLGEPGLEQLLPILCREIACLEAPMREQMERGMLQGDTMPVAALPLVIAHLGYDPSRIWEPEGLLFHRIVEASAAGIVEAAAAIEREISRSPRPAFVTQKLLLQIRNLPDDSASRVHALELALSSTSAADAVIVLLAKTISIVPGWVPLLPAVETLAITCLRRGDPDSRARCAKLLEQLARLTARAPLDWDELLARGLEDREEAARAGFLGAVRYLMIADPTQWSARLNQLLARLPEGETARAQIFAGVSTVLRTDPDLCKGYFPRLFEAVFRHDPSSEAVLSLARPMYVLEERGWADLAAYCERLIEQSPRMSRKTAHRIYRVFAKLFIGLGATAGTAWCLRLLHLVPKLHPEVARLVLPLALNLDSDTFRLLVEFYSQCEGVAGGTLAKISALRTERERRTGVSLSGEVVSDYIAQITASPP